MRGEALQALVPLLALVLAGCTGVPFGDQAPARDCSISITPDSNDPRRGVEIPASLLMDHPNFQAMIERRGSATGEHRGASTSIACAEGVAIMNELEASGATIRLFDGAARDTIVLLDREPYQLLLSTTVVD